MLEPDAFASIDETKKRVDHTAWLYQKQARVYRQLSEKLYHLVNVRFDPILLSIIIHSGFVLAGSFQSGEKQGNVRKEQHEL